LQFFVVVGIVAGDASNFDQRALLKPSRHKLFRGCLIECSLRRLSGYQVRNDLSRFQVG
jgi:hypothetical protein